MSAPVDLPETFAEAEEILEAVPDAQLEIYYRVAKCLRELDAETER